MMSEVPSKGKMWADIILFFLWVIPLCFSIICFGAAGVGFIAYDMTPLVDRLMYMGGILFFVSFILSFSIGISRVSEYGEDEEDEEEDED